MTLLRLKRRIRQALLLSYWARSDRSVAKCYKRWEREASNRTTFIAQQASLVRAQGRKLEQLRTAVEMIRSGYLGQNDRGDRVFTNGTLDTIDAARRI